MNYTEEEKDILAKFHILTDEQKAGYIQYLKNLLKEDEPQ